MTPDTPTDTQILAQIMELVSDCEATFHSVVALGLRQKPAHEAARSALRARIASLEAESSSARRARVACISSSPPTTATHTASARPLIASRGWSSQ